MSQPPSFCPHCGAPINPAARFCAACGQPIAAPVPPPAYAPPSAPPAYASPPAYQQSQPYLPAAPARPRRKRRSCLTCLGCLGLAIIPLAIAGGGIFWWRFRPGRSDNLALGKREVVASSQIDPVGGRVVVDQPGSPIDGLAVTVPAGAYPEKTAFTISARPVEGHQFGPDFDPVTPLIRIDNGHEFSAQPMTVEIPLQLAEGEFAMAFFYDERSGRLEGIPPVTLSRDALTILTAHFSDLVVTRVDEARLRDIELDSGFLPSVDDWQFKNRGTAVAPNGHCAGMSLTAMWYYLERHLAADEPALNGRFDNNAYSFRSPGLWEDDSWGIRWASTVQHATDWDAWSRTASMWLGRASDDVTWNAFVYAMALTGEPQYAAVGYYQTDAQGSQTRVGHALVVYRIAGGRLYVADPNWPGQFDRSILFQNGAFLPYPSGQNADDIDTAGPVDFTEIRYMAKSALIDWAQIGQLYQAMLKDEVGQGVFPAYTLSVPIGRDDEGKPIVVEFPRLLELTEEQTAEMGEDSRGQLLYAVQAAADANLSVHVFNGTVDKGALERTGTVGGFYVLEPGVNHVGWLTTVKDADGTKRYVDFWRTKVIYGPVDLTGAWEGTWRIQEAVNAAQYVEEMLVRILLATGLAENEQQAREMAQASIEEAPGLYEPRPWGVVFDPPPADRPNEYPIRVVTEDDQGVQYESAGTAVYQEGKVTFSFKTADGSTFDFHGDLAQTDSLEGTFGATAWLVVKDALSGEWELTRQSP